MRIKYYIVLCVLLISLPCWATTYYMATDGNDSTGDGSSETPWLTLSHSFGAMSGSDTLIIKDGTYTGSSNMIGTYETAVEPPVGTSGAYTTIQAENDGGVIFDGQDARWMFYVVGSGARYWRFEGIIWQNMTEDTISVIAASYIKFLRCGVGDTASGNYSNFGIGTDAAYILAENCYAFGTGRYKFSAYEADHIIFRQCVARHDSINASNEPVANFAAYSSTYVKIQNCIAIDSDQTTYWSNIGEYSGAFYVPCTSGVSQYIDFDQCIAVNVKLGGMSTGVNNGPSRDVNFRNIAFWDVLNPSTSFAMIRGQTNTISGCTIGSGDSGGTDQFFYADYGDAVLKNNIFYNNQPSGNLISLSGTQDYNCFYGNTNTTGTSGANNITGTDPTAASLLYLPRIESGSALDGAGESGADMGANAMTLLGTSGALWGQAGYDVDTEVSMWPFPNEDLIKTKMAAYSDGALTGARGFAASGTQLNGVDDITLTSYIWEYLGNQMPIDIYGSEEPPTVSNLVPVKQIGGAAVYRVSGGMTIQ